MKYASVLISECAQTPIKKSFVLLSSAFHCMDVQKVKIRIGIH